MTRHVIYVKKKLCPASVGGQRCYGSGSLQMRTRLRADRNSADEPITGIPG